MQWEGVSATYEKHTRSCVKGERRMPGELGVPVSVVESEHQFVSHCDVMWAVYSGCRYCSNWGYDR